MKVKIIFCLIFLSLSVTLQANEGSTGWRNLLGFGCHLNDGICYLDIDGAPVGASQCRTTNIRFNTKASENGDVWASMLLAAYVSGKRVNLNISGCYGNYPTFDHGRIEK